MRRSPELQGGHANCSNCSKYSRGSGVEPGDGHGGSEGVGWATTRAVVNTSLAVIVLNLIISTAGLLIFGG